MIEQVAHAQGQTSLARAGHHLNREYAVPSHLEEAVLGPDKVHAQHFGKDPAQHRLCRGDGGGHGAFTRGILGMMLVQLAVT